MPGRKENWGGTREGAGRKPKWNSGKTTAIRIPEIFSDKLLELARYWDEGNPHEPQFPELAQNLPASIPQSPAPADSLPQFDIVPNQHEIVQNQLQQRIEELERTHSQHESVQNQLQQRIEQLKQSNEQLLCELHSEQARANSIDEKLKQASITINQLQAELKLIQEEKVILLAQIETYKRDKEIANTDIQKVLDRLDYHTRSKKEKGGYEANNATALKNIVKNVLPELKKALKLLDNNLT